MCFQVPHNSAYHRVSRTRHRRPCFKFSHLLKLSRPKLWQDDDHETNCPRFNAPHSRQRVRRDLELRSISHQLTCHFITQQQAALNWSFPFRVASFNSPTITTLPLPSQPAWHYRRPARFPVTFLSWSPSFFLEIPISFSHVLFSSHSIARQTTKPCDCRSGPARKIRRPNPSSPSAIKTIAARRHPLRPTTSHLTLRLWSLFIWPSC